MDAASLGTFIPTVHGVIYYRAPLDGKRALIQYAATMIVFTQSAILTAPALLPVKRRLSYFVLGQSHIQVDGGMERG